MRVVSIFLSIPCSLSQRESCVRTDYWKSVVMEQIMNVIVCDKAFLQTRIYPSMLCLLFCFVFLWKERKLSEWRGSLRVSVFD